MNNLAHDYTSYPRSSRVQTNQFEVLLLTPLVAFFVI